MKQFHILVYINAIRLPKRSEVKQSQEGKLAIVSGWGRTDPGKKRCQTNKFNQYLFP
jgi:hypothetical protein